MKKLIVTSAFLVALCIPGAGQNDQSDAPKGQKRFAINRRCSGATA